MQHHIICPKTGGLFLFSDFQERSTKALLASSALYKIIYNYGEVVNLDIGASKKVLLHKGEILFCKPYPSLEIESSHTNFRVIAFNTDFYALKTKEDEIEFHSFWFSAFKDRLVLSLNDIEHSSFKRLFKNIENELIFKNKSLVTQRDILKRIIRFTYVKIQKPENNIVLESKQLYNFKYFNQLIESYYKKNTSFEKIVKYLPKHRSFFRRIIYKVSSTSNLVLGNLISRTSKQLN